MESETTHKRTREDDKEDGNRNCTKVKISEELSAYEITPVDIWKYIIELSLDSLSAHKLDLIKALRQTCRLFYIILTKGVLQPCIPLHRFNEFYTFHQDHALQFSDILPIAIPPLIDLKKKYKYDLLPWAKGVTKFTFIKDKYCHKCNSEYEKSQSVNEMMHLLPDETVYLDISNIGKIITHTLSFALNIAKTFPNLRKLVMPIESRECLIYPIIYLSETNRKKHQGSIDYNSTVDLFGRRRFVFKNLSDCGIHSEIASRNDILKRIRRDHKSMTISFGPVKTADHGDMTIGLLEWTCSQEYADITEWLIKNDKEEGIDKMNNFEYISALGISIEKRNLPMVRFLIQNGANVNGLSSKFNTPLCESILRLSRRFTKDRSPVEDDEQSKETKMDIISFLIKSGAGTNMKNPTGLTPLFYAVWVGDMQIVKMLLTHGANPNANIQSFNGFTVMTIAVMKKNKEMIALLSEYVKEDIIFDLRDSVVFFDFSSTYPISKSVIYKRILKGEINSPLMCSLTYYCLIADDLETARWLISTYPDAMDKAQRIAIENNDTETLEKLKSITDNAFIYP